MLPDMREDRERDRQEEPRKNITSLQWWCIPVFSHWRSGIHKSSNKMWFLIASPLSPEVISPSRTSLHQRLLCRSSLEPLWGLGGLVVRRSWIQVSSLSAWELCGLEWVALPWLQGGLLEDRVIRGLLLNLLQRYYLSRICNASVFNRNPQKKCLSYFGMNIMGR